MYINEHYVYNASVFDSDLNKMAARVPTIKFNNGKTVPIIGLGTWKVRFFIIYLYFQRPTWSYLLWT